MFISCNEQIYQPAIFFYWNGYFFLKPIKNNYVWTQNVRDFLFSKLTLKPFLTVFLCYLKLYLAIICLI